MLTAIEDNWEKTKRLTQPN